MESVKNPHLLIGHHPQRHQPTAIIAKRAASADALFRSSMQPPLQNNNRRATAGMSAASSLISAGKPCCPPAFPNCLPQIGNQAGLIIFGEALHVDAEYRVNLWSSTGLVEDGAGRWRALAGGAEAVGEPLPLSVNTLRRTNGPLARKRSRKQGCSTLERVVSWAIWRRRRDELRRGKFRTVLS